MEFKELYKIIKKRIDEKPEGSYISKLVENGIDRIIQKVGEEAIEVVIAAKNTENKQLISESSDLIFHLLVLLVKKGVLIEDIENELLRRR